MILIAYDFRLKLDRIYTVLSCFRTRDQKLLDECDIVVDVGGVFDPERRRFDHHQK